MRDLRPIKRIVLATHQLPAVAAEAMPDVLSVLRERDVEILLPPGETAKHPELLEEGAQRCCQAGGREELAEADLCLVLGGDGTMLRALRLTRGLGLPVAGINLGRVGFFTAVERHHIAGDLLRILQGDYVAHSLLGLAAQLDSVPLRAVNDIVVTRQRDGGICRISYALQGVSLFDVRCDGLIVATPAGSSAYSLAAGGPLLGIDVPAYVMTYLAPHSLVTRPVVAGADETVVVRNETGHEAVDVVVDGEPVGRLDPLGSLEITTVPGLATLALLPESDFYRHFRERFV